MDKSKNKSRKKSVIIGFLDMLGEKFRAVLSNSFIGNLATSYDKTSEKFEHSVTCSAVKKVTHSDRLSKMRRSATSAFDRSYVRKATLGLTSTMRHCTMRCYGVFMFTFALYVALMYLIRKFGMFYSASLTYLNVSVSVAFLSLPYLFDKKKTLGATLLDSKFFSWLLFDFFELRYENFRDNEEPIDKPSIAFIIGMVLGCLSFFVSPIKILLLLGFVFFFYFSLVTPESALLLSVFFLPLLSLFEHPTIALCVLVGCISVGYVGKLIRKKRVFHFGVLEALVILFSLFLLFGGMRNASMKTSYASFVMVLLAGGFFLCSNLLRTKDMINHAARAFALSSVICAVVGIAECILGFASLDWLDTEMFSSIEGRAVSFFENPNVLGTYLCFGAPLTLSFMSVSKEKKKARWFLGFVAILVCSVLTWSRGAWIGMIVSVLMMLACTKHFFAVVGSVALVIPFGVYVIPQSVIDRFFSIGNLSDSSTSYRLNIWRACCEMASEYGLGGIGVGEEAFSRLYPQFSVAGAEIAYHSHSLWLQILLMLGVCGFAVFVLVLFFFAQRSFSALKYGSDNDVKYILAGTMSGVAGLLVCGLFDYSWYNYRVYFVFFAMMGIACACDRACRNTEGGLYE